MLHGIDISNWQKGMRIPDSVDFCIVKATEGFRYVDPCMEGFIQQCVEKGILFGFYHFARIGDPETQATHFWETVKKYDKLGIPVLDIEDENIEGWGAFSQRFCDKYHAITGVWPLVYTSASYLPRFKGYPLTENCDLWVAGYPDTRVRGIGDVPSFNYSITPWPYAAIWQYSATGRVTNWNENVDLDVAYMTRDAWHLYADPDSKELGDTQAIPATVGSETLGSTHVFEDDTMKVSITLK